MRWTAPGWRGTLLGIAAAALIGAAVPPARHSMEWPAGLPPRRAAVYVALSMLTGFAMRELQHRLRGTLAAVAAEARERLGREPSEDELHEQFARRMLRGSLGREPTDDEVKRALRPGGEAA